jgi:hypothetical protein
MEASVAFLDAYRARHQDRVFRERVHQALDRFLDQLEDAMMAEEGSLPTLWSVTETVRQERAGLTASIVQAYLERRYASYFEQEYAPCPDCSKPLKARKPRPRTVETLVGSICLERPYFYCSVCARGFYPLDQALGLSEHTKQYDIQEAAIDLALEMPYAQAATLLDKWTDASASDCFIHEVLNQMSGNLDVLDVCPTTNEIQDRITQVAQKQRWKPIVVLGIDGADVPTRPETAQGTRPGRKKVRARRARWKGQYREAKGVRLFLVDEDRIVHLLSWHQIQTDEELEQALEKIQQTELIPEEQIRLCAIADGAPWIWKVVERLFPSARQILDYYHCSSYLHTVAQTQYNEEPLKARQWLEAAMARLFCNEGAGVVWGLQRMKPASDQAEIAIEDALTYLSKRLAQITYGAHRKGGYPIGSGAIESAHKFICHVRLKRSGAWWYTTNSNQMMALRCAQYNGTLERVFHRYANTIPLPSKP